jgi:phage tail-like protein
MALVQSPMMLSSGQDEQVLYGNFAFHVQFIGKKGPFTASGDVNDSVLGAFSEISGLEASMEHKVVRQGGVNYGARMLVGPVSFGTVILKRGIARSQTLWRWWSMFAGADGVMDGRPTKDNRSDVLIGLISTTLPKDAKPNATAERKVAMGWMLRNAMPVKFRVADLNAKGTDVAVEELHLVHEGLHVSGVAK